MHKIRLKQINLEMRFEKASLLILATKVNIESTKHKLFFEIIFLIFFTDLETQ